MTVDPKAVESLIAFWADAGVDVAYADAPVNRTIPVRTSPARVASAGVSAGRAPDQPSRSTAEAPMARAVLAKTVPLAPPPPDLGQARALARAATTLEELEAAIAAFEGCSLRTAGAATRAVFARGDPAAPVMVIGEGPGAEEDASGKPFVGRAGKMLDRMLAAAGLTDRVFITNTVFWRPPGNRTPAPAEQLICQPFVERAIELVSPKLLLLVGGASAKSILGVQEGILSLRGRWFEWKSSDGSLELPALPTLHPAFLLRQPAAKKRAWEDLLTLTERLDRPERPA